ncbi:MAG TPA: diguanylate cyclase, partial [Verrucomicrobiae bacterium]|nr:diguanylate cyclase [Verrucomicrobiae bacterium]
MLESDYTVIFWNRCIEEWSGIGRSDIVGKRIFTFFPHLETPRYLLRIGEIFAGGAPTVFSSQLHRHFLPCPLPAGALRVLYTVATAVPTPHGRYRAMFSLQDVTALTQAIEGYREEHRRLGVEMEERKKTEEQLQEYAKELGRLNDTLAEKAIRDGLTGLYNHRHFYTLLERDFLLAQRHGGDISCLVIDLDFFKAVNDTHGHLVGDRVLETVAQSLRETVRETDVVARHGGEEFVVLLPNTGIEGALAVAEAVRKSIAGLRLSSEQGEVTVTASIGVAGLSSHQPATAAELVGLADAALYSAKGRGRNQVHVAPES